MALAYQTLASSDQAGALVTGISGAEAALLAATNPAALVGYFNSALVSALQGLPEQTRVELDISGWTVAGQSLASYAAQQINSAWASGRIDYNGEAVQPWPEYPTQVAWGDDSTATVTIRVLKAQWEAILFVAIGILVVVAVWILWDNWRSPSTPWTAQVAYQQGTTPPLTGQGVLAWAARNWAWLLLGAGVLAAGPWAFRQFRRLREEETQYASEFG